MDQKSLSIDFDSRSELPGSFMFMTDRKLVHKIQVLQATAERCVVVALT